MNFFHRHKKAFVVFVLALLGALGTLITTITNTSCMTTGSVSWTKDAVEIKTTRPSVENTETITDHEKQVDHEKAENIGIFPPVDSPAPESPADSSDSNSTEVK